MARIKVKGLVGKTNRAGFTTWYWEPNNGERAAGWRPLGFGKELAAAIAGCEKRNAEIQQWRLGGRRPAGVKRKDAAGTFGALVQRYRRERLNGTDASGRPLLRPATIKSYEASLKRLEEWAGKHPLAYITPARVRALRDAVARPIAKGGIGHAPAHSLLKTLRVVMAFAESVDAIPKGSNPAKDFALAAPAPRKTVWLPEDEAAFDAAAFDLGLPSMALAREIALYTAQRECDLIAFTEGQLVKLDIFDRETRKLFADADGMVWGWSFSQRKTSTHDADVVMEIPLEPRLLEKVLKALRTNRARDRAITSGQPAPRRLLSYVIVNDETGDPFYERSFIRAWTRIIAHAVKMTGRESMRQLNWHDLRRTRVVRLRRRRMPKEMIASITGHSLAAIEAMLKVYGPVDSTMTAAALATTLDTPADPADDAKEKSA